MKKTGIALFLLLLAASGISAQEKVMIKRVEGTISFDGIPEETAWSALAEFGLTMHRPNFGNQPSELSDIRIGYDNEYLWIGAKLFMKDATKIFSPSKKRDEELFDYDAFGIVLDTYDDNENALAFFTNPSGLRTDYTISNDAQMDGGPGFNSAMNTSWNTFWDVKTAVDDRGWYVEMRIPFSSLKFKPENDIATMGLIISRNISLNNETDTYPAIDPKYGFLANNKPSLAASISISGARPKKPVYVSPYVIGGVSQDWILNQAETDYVKNEEYPEYKWNAGLDVKYNINSNLTLDLTTNTDFAQVEADDQQVNLTRYSLFFPEKRMFFQERSSLFDFALGDHSDNLFYSRNIGISNGEQIRILGGARLTGRLGKWDMGFMDMQTGTHTIHNTALQGEEPDLRIPGENFGVLRMRRQVINENSYVGGILTSRIDVKGKQNLAYGADGIFRLFGDDYLNVKWSQTYDSELGNKLNSLDPSFLLVNWQRRSEEGFAYDFKYFYSGQEFNPGLGFVRMEGVQGMNGGLMYGWIPGENSKLFNYGVSLRGDRYTRISDGGLESVRVSPEFEINTKKGIHGSLELEYQEEGVLFPFPLAKDIIIEAGTYSFLGGGISIGTPNTKLISFNSEIQAGQFYDGRRAGLNIMSDLNLSSSLKVSCFYEFNAIRFPGRDGKNSLDIHSVNLKTLYMLNTKLSASILLQYVNTEDEMIANFRLRYNPKEGNDFYLVYNDFRGLNNRSGTPSPPPFFNRTVMVKYTHTFIL
ncbi:MAG TPA: DUF5916 domain-containing protein [Bacteroidales bacterium]|nr:DUF5916 domain-containing protein [Bacteroidales bacterium]